jgi:WD40 repeat protein
MADFWPTSADYQDAIQNPALNLADPELCAATPACNQLGLPVACSGNYADVYHLVSANGGPSWAVKCFTRRVVGLRERYQAISAHLSQAKLPFTVAFQYLPGGIRIHGEWFPILKMDWVEGQTLQEFIQRHHSDRGYIARLLNIWLKVEPRLRSAQTAHGDLQHGNVLLVPGKTKGTLSLRLIDYDGLWTPALAATPSGEAGHAAYQHPRRAPNPQNAHPGVYSSDIDRFPHLVIAAALTCLTHPDGPRFWQTYHNGDNLLFAARDFAVPTESRLLRELWDSGDDELQAWAGLIATAASYPLEATPLLEKRLVDGRLQSLSPQEASTAREILGAAAPKAAKKGAAPDAEARDEWWNDPALLEQEAVEAEPEPLPTLPGRGAKKQATPVKEESAGWSVDQLVLAGVGVVVATALAVGGVAFYAGGRETKKNSTTATENSFTNPGSDAKATAAAATPEVIANPSDPWSENRLTLTGHGDFVVSIAFSPDSAILASGGYDGTIKLWNVARGTELRTLARHRGSVVSVAFASDGRVLASSDMNDPVRLWDVATGTELQILWQHSRSVRSVAFSPDGATLALGGGDLAIVDVATGDALRTLTARHGTAYSVAFAPDGVMLASGNGDNTIALWDLTTGAELRTLVGHRDSVRSVAFAPDGVTLASGSEDETIRIWDLASGAELRTLRGHQHSVDSLAFSPDGSVLASDGGFDVRLWDIVTGTELRRLKGHDRGVASVAFAPDGQTVATAGADGAGDVIRLWGPGPVAPDQPRQQKDSSNAPSNALATIPTAQAGPPTPWSKVRLSWMGDQRGVYALALSPDGRTLASGGQDARVKLWDAASGKQLNELLGHTNLILSVAFSPDGQRLVTGGMDGTARVWDFASGKQLASETVAPGGAGTLPTIFAPSGVHIGAGCPDGTIRWLRSTTSSSRPGWTGSTANVSSLAYGPDGRLLASGSGDGTIRLWLDSTGAQVQVLRGHTGNVNGVAFAPFERKIASISGDLKLWNIDSGKELLTINAAAGFSVAFSPDGRFLATGMSDGTITLWDAATGAGVESLQGHAEMVRCLAFSTDGTTLASAAGDGTIKLWGAGPTAPPAAAAPADPAPPDAASAEPLFDLFIIPNSVNQITSTDPARTIQTHGVAATAAELQAVRAEDGALLQNGQYHLFRVPNRGPSDVTFAGGVKTANGAQPRSATQVWTWENDRFQSHGRRNVQPIERQTVHVDRPASEPWLYVLANAGYGDEQILTDAFSARLTSSRAVSEPAPNGSAPAGASTLTPAPVVSLAQWRQMRLKLGAHPVQVNSVALSQDGRTLASLDYRDGLKIWDVATGRARFSSTVNTAFSYHVALASDNRTVASAHADGLIQLWDANTGKVLHSWKAHENHVMEVAFSPDGRMLASGSNDHLIGLWDAASASLRRRVGGLSGEVDALAFAPDGLTLASGTRDGLIQIWNVRTGAQLRLWPGGAGGVRSVAFSADGSQLASGSLDGSISLWQVATGRPTWKATGHAKTAESVAFTPDGLTLASGSADGTVKLWDASSGRALATLSEHSNPVTSVAFSGDGRTLASGSGDQTIILWGPGPLAANAQSVP